jgi:hypothetical protein
LDEKNYEDEELSSQVLDLEIVLTTDFIASIWQPVKLCTRMQMGATFCREILSLLAKYQSISFQT